MDDTQLSIAMDLTNKMLLQQHQKDIVKDLDIQYIIDHLFANEAISKEDFDRICDLTSRAERARYFIDSLIQNGNNHSYNVFVESLGKDYRWLSDKLTPETMSPSKINDSFEDSLSRGDVPRLPIHYVQRDKLEQDITAKLKALTRHKTLALHGMSGSGKTSVAVGVLRHNAELITSTFNGAVFWLNFGNVKTEDDIVIQQNKLHRKASTMFTHRDSSIFMNSSISMSSIGSNADSQSLSNNDWSWQELRDVLKTLFGEPALKEALLVLDEVNEKKVVEAFDIGCRMLVTTRDSGVVANFQAQIVEIANRFEENESLQLIASSIDVDVSELPRQARKFNEKISSGSPFLTGLIAAQLAANKERLLHNPSHWNVYRKKLENKDNFFYFTHQENPMKKTLAVCMNSLKSDILALYKMLAILPDNVKVTAEVLSKLWTKQTRDVERILKELKSKSLITESYNPDQRNYNYEVHDLIMTHMRKNSSEDEIKKLHATFLKSYNYDTISNSPVELVDDGYIAFYIGYHIHRTGNVDNKWGLFKLYLNLKFLGNKVRLTGPADAIIDLHKYENTIANGELDIELLHSTRSFLSTHGVDLYRYPRTDIVQSILQHESKGILYARAYQMAQENCLKNELFFEMSHEQGLEEIKPSTIDVKEKICSVCFLGDYVLVGTAKGVIKVYHVSTNKLKKELASAGSSVTWLGTCPSNGLIVAALTSQGVVRIWYMDDIDQDSENSIEEESDEPVYDENPGTPVTIQPKLGAYLSCRWSNNAEILVTHTSKMIILYDIDGRVVQLIDNIDREKIIVCCVPSNDDRHVIAATCLNAVYFVEVIDVATKERVVAFEESVAVTSLLVVPSSNRILVHTPNEVLEHEYNIRPYPSNNRNTYSWKPVISAKDVKENLSFITAILNKSGTLLFIATDDSRVICVCLKTNSYVFDLGNRRGNVISLAVSEVWYDEFMPGSDVLLTGTDATENSAKVWYLDASYVSHTTQKHRKDRLTTLFDASFTHPASPHTPPAALPAPPRRHQSFATPPDQAKRPAAKTRSLDRHALKPLNLKGICNGNEEGVQPLLAVVDDKSNIQIIRGKKVLTEIPSRSDDKISTVRLSPCNQYVIFGSTSGAVRKYILRSKETQVIMDIYSPVQYMQFLNSNLLVVAGKNRCLMAYTFNGKKGEWRSEMLLKGNMSLGSQELLNGIQGNKKKNGNSDSLSRTDSEASITSKERQFPTSDHKNLCKNSGIVDCYWVAGVGMLTIENNATIKLWGQDSLGDTKMTLICVLNGRQTDVNVVCAAFQKNVLAICDEYGKFQTFSLRENQDISLRTINDSKVPFKIMSCDLTADGHILAMGLDSGDVVIWNVPGKCQLNFVRHHKSKVQTCLFSPVPDKLYRSNSQTQSPAAGQVLNHSGSDEEQSPLVLVTMATEIVWWDVTRLMRTRAYNKTSWRTRVNVLTPQPSPLEARDVADLAAGLDGMSIDAANGNFFFSGARTAHDCWEQAWRRKTYKEGSKSREILACIKLSGMNAKKLVADDKFSCFVTVDNPGHVHIMNLMRPTQS